MTSHPSVMHHHSLKYNVGVTIFIHNYEDPVVLHPVIISRCTDVQFNIHKVTYTVNIGLVLRLFLRVMPCCQWPLWQ